MGIHLGRTAKPAWPPASLTSSASVTLAVSRPSGESWRLQAISNTVDDVRFTPAQPEKRSGSKSRRHEGADHVVLIVGHLSEVKGYPTFLEAAARVARTSPTSSERPM
jgi:glycosyltransferase involved in cell wall biosynthesis